MTNTNRTPSKAVAAGTAAGLRHLERVYVSKVNAAVADDRTDLAHELADDMSAITGSEDAAGCHRQSRRTRPLAYRLFGHNR